MSRQLSGSRLALAQGLTDVPIEQVLKYRELWQGMGYALPELQTEPNLLTKAKHFGRASAEHIRNALRTVPEEIRQEREALCSGCPLLDQERKVCVHPSCGCDMTIKWTWAEQACPLLPPRWAAWREK